MSSWKTASQQLRLKEQSFPALPQSVPEWFGASFAHELGMLPWYDLFEAVNKVLIAFCQANEAPFSAVSAVLFLPAS